MFLAVKCTCSSTVSTHSALRGTALRLAQGSLPFLLASAHQIYSTRVLQRDHKQSCVGFWLKPHKLPEQVKQEK